ncbi:hypothetical protein E4U21_004259 [Claviceps maximensis]|nr:hypothetical protein E4U21_004259 [Claviceps maximensis]
MQYFSLLLAAAAVASASVAGVDKRFTLNVFCAGTEPASGTCDKLNAQTRCCSDVSSGTYNDARTPIMKVDNAQGISWCDDGNGAIYCV